jgi:Transposase DDE domain
MAGREAMASKRPRLQESDVEGLEYFGALMPLLARLRDLGTARDKASNRQLFCDQYICLLLLYFFNPTITSLRGLQQASTLETVQRRLKIRATSLGSFSEAARVFDAGVLHGILQELALKAVPLVHDQDAKGLLNLTAVDGSIFRAFPRMAWALWKDDTHRGVKLHLHFDVFCAIPTDAVITPAACSEPGQLQVMLQPGRLYVIDRGYLDHELYREILEAKSSFIARIKDNAAYTAAETRPLSNRARAAGIVSDERIERLGTSHHKDVLKGHQLRLIKTARDNEKGESQIWWLLTDKLDLDPELVVLGYQYRWTIELFFRWLKCVLGCKQLLTTSANGVALQIYTALIASLLIVLWTGRKPAKRTWEMLQLYFQGWATVDEVQNHIEKQKLLDQKKQEKEGNKGTGRGPDGI